MTYQRLAYDDAATTADMRMDAAAVGRELHLRPEADGTLGCRPLDEAPLGPPQVSDDLAELAAGLELHLD